MAEHLTYSIATGKLYQGKDCYSDLYSGFPPYKNLPQACNVHDLGPIPTGWWDIVGEPYDDEKLGPFVLRLAPRSDVVLYGRDGSSFRFHGDSKEHPGLASHGCIVGPRLVREDFVWNSGIRLIHVVPSVTDQDITPPEGIPATPIAEEP